MVDMGAGRPFRGSAGAGWTVGEDRRGQRVRRHGDNEAWGRREPCGSGRRLTQLGGDLNVKVDTAEEEVAEIPSGRESASIAIGVDVSEIDARVAELADAHG